MTLTAATMSGRMTLYMLMFLAGWKLAAISIAASLYRSQALVLSFRSLSFVLYITWCIVTELFQWGHVVMDYSLFVTNLG